MNQPTAVLREARHEYLNLDTGMHSRVSQSNHPQMTWVVTLTDMDASLVVAQPHFYTEEGAIAWAKSCVEQA
jgi:hypothetical protein